MKPINNIVMYTKKDFEKCKFNPITEENIFDVYPDLQDIYPGEDADENVDCIMKFTIMVYDPKSPYVETERDIIQRKKRVMNDLDIDDDTLREELLRITHGYASMLAIKFLKRFVKSKQWAAIVALEFCYWESIEKLAEPIREFESKKVLEAVQKKSAIKTEIKADLATLDQLYDQFFAGDKQMEEVIKKSKFSPEQIAVRV